MLKVFVYPEARPHVHDELYCVNCVPWSKMGLTKCDLTSDHPNIYYMGQFSDGHHDVDLKKFPHFLQHKDKHWCDIEGDWMGKQIPQVLNGCNITVNGAELGIESRFNKIFVRPTFSKFLVNAAKNRFDTFELPQYKTFGFSGHMDPYGLRGRLYNIIQGLPNEFEFTNTWKAPEDLLNGKKPQYEHFMNKHLLALCPRGAGHDTARFYEICFFGRVPIIIGNNYILGEPYHKFDFFFRINHNLPNHIIKLKLQEIYALPISVLQKKALEARQYFDLVIREYFKCPTAFLLNFFDF